MERDPAATLLRIENVSVVHDGKAVVDRVSLNVQRGQVVAIIGPSGAGKSSLLRTVNFLQQPAGGSIHLAGEEVRPQGRPGSRKYERSLRKHRRRVGVVFQHFNLFPHLTALENVVVAQVHVHGRDTAEAKARALAELERLNLRDCAGKLPGQCSGGQQQRIAIARALALDPEIILFDEPTSAIDPELSAEVLDALKGLAAQGITMLVVTHEMKFAQEVADEVVFMAGGRIVDGGPSAEFFQNPSTERARKFLQAVGRW
ncbi:MAG: amino acid ABC transporter ATP-binding protein [Propionibacteriaceae bacterium]|nr:amino acid ABC transporter ATP-binding protein [Propionibacteriaceae bacterium]